MSDMTNEDMQDAYAELVEECRTHRVYRVGLVNDQRGKRYTSTPHDPKVDLADVPVFAHTLDVPDVEEVWLADLRLPYERCVFITEIPPDLDPSNIGRYYAVVCEEEEDGSILCFGFFRPHNHKHWSRQLWQVTIGADRKDISFAVEPNNAGEAFLTSYSKLTWLRVALVTMIIAKMATPNGGSVMQATGGKETARVDLRREKLGLPGIPKIRIIDFNKEPPAATDAPKQVRRSGWKQPENWRRGAWREYKSGRRTFVKGYKAGGGGSSAPPWYEVR